MRIFSIAVSMVLLGSAAAFCGGNAKITREQAQKTAMERVKGGVAVKSAELEKEKGREVWSFDLKTPAGIREIWVDAETGAVVLDQAESKAEEKKEAARDREENKARRLGARLTREQATGIAMARAKGAAVKDSELEKEHGRLVWSFDLLDSGKIREIQVDARSGAIVEDKIETPADEKAEAAADRKDGKLKSGKRGAEKNENPESGENGESGD